MFRKILLAVTTVVELDAVFKTFNVSAKDSGTYNGGAIHYYKLGYHNGREILMVRIPAQGRGALGGAQETLGQSLDQLQPDAVILVGIAFGCDKRKQDIGDVLVSSRLCLYELQRVSQVTAVTGGLPIVAPYRTLPLN